MFAHLSSAWGRSLVATAAVVVLAAPVALAADQAALNRLVADAAKTGTQRMIIWQNGKPVLDKRWSGNNEALQPIMHITAPISALAISCLLEDGRIADLEASATAYFPEWKNTPKSAINLAHIQWGRTGLTDNSAAIGTLFTRPDMVAYFASRPLEHEVGAHFNDESAVLIARVVQKAAGEPIDKYLQRRLFTPMGITQTRWRRDKAGNVDTATGLWLKPSDLAKVGELIRLDGRFNGKQHLPADYIQDATLAGEDAAVGDYWRIGQRFVLKPEDLQRLQQHGFPNARKLAPMVNRTFPSRLPFVEEAARLAGNETYRNMNDAEKRFGGLPYTIAVGREYGVEASDYLGQTLYINPTTKLVMVRTVPWNGAPVTRSYPHFAFDDMGDRANRAFGGK
ncbi:MAG: serine hydrolase domain-containing protein [Candidatus Sericytochromatia bacterium]